MVGLGSESYLIYMFDFGNAFIYKSQNNMHIPYQSRVNNFDLIFSSINNHLKIQPSRRDDM
ncbi:UNVERIFIED_CONTAM: hypothetical protein GTU68_037219 [Idotea baltica]|nr:hypothetical protein [Idotea baltica]